MLYLSENDRENLEKWTARERFLMDSKIKEQLMDLSKGYQEIKSLIPEYFDNYESLEASGRFGEGVVIISMITNVIVTYLTGENDNTDELPGLFAKVMETMTDGFVLLGR